jgi:predicted nucleic acid-binding protein
MRIGAASEVEALVALLGRLELLAIDRATTDAATALGGAYGLRAADSVHLATAVIAGAERFVTNNRRDFSKPISEVTITFPDDLEP